MRKSEIKVAVTLDEKNTAKKIEWDADDKGDAEFEEIKAVSISLWDHHKKNTLRMDLWTDEMPVDEMKRMIIDTVGGLAQTVLSATGDEAMAHEMNHCVDRMVQHVLKEHGPQN
ncbi:MAG: gliding motility protein GldC [Cyclobacteriaceae bacterium]|nr:gliding motility protein GldC [Cyclobacteriaceae bacterium]MCH8517381.1 gliding motility protein GldC [Cyclobacteriaceae bacterium]